MSLNFFTHITKENRFALPEQYTQVQKDVTATGLEGNQVSETFCEQKQNSEYQNVLDVLNSANAELDNINNEINLALTESVNHCLTQQQTEVQVQESGESQNFVSNIYELQELKSSLNENTFVSDSLDDCINDNMFDTKSLDINSEDISVKQCSAAGFYGTIIGSVIDAFDGNTKDGKISATKQGGTGDCWLLSAVNALNATEKGREIIKDSLDYQKDGTIVHLKGYGDVWVSDNEVTTTKGSFQYSSGDDDMIILELAVEKVMDKIANHELLYTDDAPSNVARSTNSTEWLNSSIGNGSTMAQALYLLTGKDPESRFIRDSKEEMLDKFVNSNGSDYAIEAGTVSDNDITVKDYYQNNVNLSGSHAYSVKYVYGDKVCILNPWDSSKEIILSKETFLDSFDLSGIDLSDKNPDKNYFIETTRETSISYNSDGDIIEKYKDSDGNLLLQINRSRHSGAVTSETRYNQKGQIKYFQEYGKNENRGEYHEYYDNGRAKSACYTWRNKKGELEYNGSFSYYENGSVSCKSEDLFANGKLTSSDFVKYDKNGNVTFEKLRVYENGRLIRTEIDSDGDGVFESIEYPEF